MRKFFLVNIRVTKTVVTMILSLVLMQYSILQKRTAYITYITNLTLSAIKISRSTHHSHRSTSAATGLHNIIQYCRICRSIFRTSRPIHIQITKYNKCICFEGDKRATLNGIRVAKKYNGFKITNSICFARHYRLLPKNLRHNAVTIWS